MNKPHTDAEITINTIRTLAMDAVQAANSGHPGTPMALAPVVYTLWQEFLRFDPEDPIWPNRDRFVLSVGHASMLLYSMLHLTGVRSVNPKYERLGTPAVSLEDIQRFRQLGSKCPGHPEYRWTSGVETTTGPLGQGAANSVGMAIAGRWLAAHYNRPDLTMFDYNVYALCGDGDMMEGVTSEAASLAGHLQLDNLCWIYDNNHITIEGHTDWAFTEDVAIRFQGYGWNVLRVGDANDLELLRRSIQAFLRTEGRPTLIIVDSHIAYGSPNKQDTSAAHGEPLGEDEIKLTKRTYGWPEDQKFLVPEAAVEHLRQGFGRRGAALRAAWMKRFEDYKQRFPELADQLYRMQHRELPDGWDHDLPEFPADPKGLASRDSSGSVLNAMAKRVPWLLGGSADLAPSTKTRLTFDDAGDLTAAAPGGRNLHFGVREHAMASVLNGMSLCKVRPFGSGFLIFSDYARPAIRLAALMELPVIHVFTHDSIGVGEDGPTHQPVEQLASLRAVPGLITIRPADANEVAQAWRVILELRHEPVALVLSRQALPTLDRRRMASAAGLQRGAYVLAEAPSGRPEVLLLATGSEVSLCLAAWERLIAEGIEARVVSMPSWELFERQPREYREQVLPPDVTARVSVEQAATFGWERYVGPEGTKIGMKSFGASAPLKELMKKFGFTPENVVAAAREQIAHRGGASKSPLRKLRGLGQSVWLDYIRRGLIQSGELERLIREDGVTGVTSNPAIFEKAIAGSSDYDDLLESLRSRRLSAQEVYEELAVRDIRGAADALLPVWRATAGRDGYVSLEVSPRLAQDTAGTIAEARRLWKAVKRDNVMIKVPGTPAGIPAIRALIGEGIHVNVTLLFARDVYRQAAEAYMDGLDDLRARGGDPSRVASVASFFVSRIDSAVDALLAERLKAEPEREGELRPLIGKAAIANARLAYEDQREVLARPRWQALAKAGARPQRLLWASTGTKNPRYRDTLYVEELIGPDTVTTLPPSTLDAFRDHGAARRTLGGDPLAAQETLERLAAAGLSLAEVTDRLLAEGLELFEQPFTKLLHTIERRMEEAKATPPETLRFPAELAERTRAALADWAAGGKVARLWARDATLWTGADEASWLGWLDLLAVDKPSVDRLHAIVEEIRGQGVADIVLLGMGGSSLCPEVMARTFGSAPGHPRLRVLDSTVPAEVLALAAQLDLSRTVFIVSSKSGTTTEPNVMLELFLERMRAAVGETQARRHFLAITDPGSKLHERARSDGFRHVFLGVPSVGGRYSALSAFGVVPAALIGVDLERLLDRAREMSEACAACVAPGDNPGVLLGVAMGVAQKAGRDKLTVVASPRLGAFGAWLEQLVAESTGKKGTGIIPVDGEELGEPSVYGDDRVFVYLRLAGEADPAHERALAALEAAGQPVVRLEIGDVHDLGAEFFRFEFATAVAGSVIGINPFDQPDVEASKVATRALTTAYERSGSLPPEEPFWEGHGIALFADPANAALLKERAGSSSDLGGYLRAHLERLQPGDYFALLAYLERNEANARLLQALRHQVRDRRRVATCLGFGPRFLHSTGQAYKGGPASGVFLQLTADARPDVAVPGMKVTFGVIAQAQARGDLQVLSERGRRALRVHLGSDPRLGLQTLAAAVERALG